MTAGVTPFFYKVITIMSGWTGMPLATFIATFILARRLRFFIVAGFLWKFGEPIRDFIEKRLGLMFTLFVPLLMGGFVVVGPYDPQPLPFVGRLWFGCFNEHGRFDFRRDLGRITCPVLVMAGEEDQITPPEFSDAIVDHLRDEQVTYAKFDRCGHGVVGDRPDEALEFLRDFVGNVSAQ